MESERSHRPFPARGHAARGRVGGCCPCSQVIRGADWHGIGWRGGGWRTGWRPGAAGVSHEELSHEVGQAQDDEEGVEEQRGPCQAVLLAEGEDVGEGRVDEHEGQAAGGS